MVCESYAERSRSEQMKCLQIWRTGIYTWNLSAGWLHLNIYNATKVVSWGKKEKQPRGETLLWKQVSNENRKQSQVPLCVLQREPSTEIDWTTQSSASPLVVPRSIMRQRMSRLERVSEGLWSDPLSSWVRVLRVLSGQVLNALGDGIQERKSNTRITKIKKIEVIKRKQNQLRDNEVVLAA